MLSPVSCNKPKQQNHESTEMKPPGPGRRHCFDSAGDKRCSTGCFSNYVGLGDGALVYMVVWKGGVQKRALVILV